MGYKLGLILSGILVFVVLVVVLIYMVFTAPSEPGREIRNLTAVKLPPPPPPDIFGSMPEGGDATGDYDAAIGLVRSFKGDPNWADIDSAGRNLAHLQKIYAAAKPAAAKGSMRFSKPDHVRVLVTYKNDPADELGDLMHALKVLSAHYIKQKRYGDDEAVLRDMAVMCMHMINEAVRLRIRQQGLMWQRDVVSAMIELCNLRGSAADDSRINQLIKYDRQLDSCMSFIDTKGRLILGTGPNPGDLYYVIDNDEDRCWRIRCIAMLGLVKYTASHSRGDRNAIEDYIERFLESPDPFEAAAARAADSLTREQFNRLADSGRPNSPGLVLSRLCANIPR